MSDDQYVAIRRSELEDVVRRAIESDRRGDVVTLAAALFSSEDFWAAIGEVVDDDADGQLVDFDPTAGRGLAIMDTIAAMAFAQLDALERERKRRDAEGL